MLVIGATFEEYYSKNVLSNASSDYSVYVSTFSYLLFALSSCGLDDLCKFVVLNICISSLELKTSCRNLPHDRMVKAK